MDDNIIDVQFGQTLPPERWRAAEEHLSATLRMLLIHEMQQCQNPLERSMMGMLLEDLTLACVALRFVAEEGWEKCRFINLGNIGGTEHE